MLHRLLHWFTADWVITETERIRNGKWRVVIECARCGACQVGRARWVEQDQMYKLDC